MHSELIQLAKAHLVKIGAMDIDVLDGVHTGRKSKYKKPLPDIVAMFKGKKLAVECGYMVGGYHRRIVELRTAGYDLVIYFPYLEVFDCSMTLPTNSILSRSRESYRDKPSV